MYAILHCSKEEIVMLKKIIISICVALSMFSAMVISSIGEVDNWMQLSTPWLVVFFLFVSIGIMTSNLDFIRRYTYPAYVCALAWANEHNLIHSNIAQKSNYIYHKHNKSYAKLYDITQYLYDSVMFAEV